ncbi:MAG: ABC transporter ATP-binding protein/permease [Eubacterium sp.]|nr:ABC transporter ATP-binding protein/permease [Eubacterium sp.]
MAEVSMRNYRLPGMRGKRQQGEIAKPKEGKKTIRRLCGYFKAELATVGWLMLAVLTVVVCSVWAPALQSDAIDEITAKNFGGLPKILITMLIVYGVSCLATLFQSLLSARLSQRIVKRLREDLFEKIINLPVKYIDNHPHGDIMSRMTNDVENISNTVSQSLSSMFSGILMIIGTVFMMVMLCPRLALLSCTTVILTLIVTKYLSKAMRKFYLKRQVLLGELNAEVEEMVTGFKTVTAYNRQIEVTKEFDETSDHLTKVGIISEILAGAMGPCMNVINNIGFVIIAAFGGYFAINGIISIGIISAFIVYAKQFGRPIDELAQVYGQILSAAAGAERVFEIMDNDYEDKSGSKNMDGAKGVIEFKNVDFSYIEGQKVLSDFSLKVEAGQKAALVGATGSGKTTVVNLLMRFYDIDKGEILIDGVNIKDIDCNELRKNTAVVLQDAVLFSDTVRNNLKYSNLLATDTAMEKAAKMSNCYDMIHNMKEGYDTFLTGSGQNISQGQRQLLTICRAFLAEPKILILDEATSSIDTRTEKNIQDAMVRLMEDRTSLIIAHRLSTIQDADIIIVLDKGKIVEKGNHKELLAQKGKYYELYMTQFSGRAT